MTGAIFGVLRRDGRRVDAGVLDRMSESLAHRGVGSAHLLDGSIALGITGTPPPSQPHDRHPTIPRELGFSALADARIDNRREVLAAFGLRADGEHAVSDDRLLLLAYRAWGAGAPARLMGDFAFVVWDERRRTLFCARDPLGVKPFYYHLSDRVLAFASEVKALLTLEGVPHEIDEVQVGFFLDGFVDGRERTFYRDVRRLPSGAFLTVGPDRSTLTHYARPGTDRGNPARSSEEYAEGLRDVLAEAVRCRVEGEERVGSSLSGGLDSSSIVCLARRVLPPGTPLHAFSAVFPSLPEPELEWIDERRFIEAVTSTHDVVHHPVPADLLDPLAECDHVAWHVDAPSPAFNLYMHWALFREAHEAGVTVFLDGLDGDSVVGHGFERLGELVRSGCWGDVAQDTTTLGARFDTPVAWFTKRHVYPQLADLFTQGRWIRWMAGSRALATAFGDSSARVMWRYGPRPHVPARAVALYRRARRKPPRTEDPPLVHPDFARRIRLRERKEESERDVRGERLPWGLLQQALELTHGIAGRFGIEPRYPFLDRRVIDFCSSVPNEEKLREGWPRSIQRRAMEGILPPLVQWRVRKADLGVNFRRGMRRFEAPWLRSALSDDRSSIAEFVDLEALRAKRARLTSGVSPATDDQDAMDVFKAAMLARWLDHPGAGPTPDDAARAAAASSRS